MAEKLIDVNGTGVLNFVDTFGSSMANWRIYYQAGRKKVSLFIPPGTYDLSSKTLVPGQPGAEVLAYGVSAKTGHFYMGVIPGTLRSGPMGRFETVDAGASQITLIKPAIYARYYPVGTWCCLMGFDLQFYGYPPNNQFHEFRQIKAIDTKTGVITLNQPLRNSYKSTWPLNLAGSYSSDDCGGPGSLFPMSGGWNSDFILRGMNITNSTGDLFGAVKNALFEDCSFNTILPAPSASKNWTMRRCKSSVPYGGIMEVDKSVEKLEFDECVGFHQIVVQSASVNELIVRNSDLPEVLGSAQETLIQGSHIRHFKLRVPYGSSRNLTIENSHIDYLETGSQDLWFSPSAFTSMTDGILVLPMGSIFKSNAAIQLCPGGSYYFGTRGVDVNIGGCFRVLDAWRDGGGTGPNWVYKTTLADPINIPSDADLVTIFGNSNKVIFQHPCTNFSVTNSFGCDTLEINSRGPKGLPLYSYHYSGLLTTGSGLGGPLWGRIERLVIKVHRPYTGTQNVWLNISNIYGPASNGEAWFIKPDLSVVKLTPRVNIKVAGTRVIDINKGIAIVDDTDVDLLPFMDGLWNYGGMSPGFVPWATLPAETPSKCPIIEVEVWTNQGPSVTETNANKWAA